MADVPLASQSKANVAPSIRCPGCKSRQFYDKHVQKQGLDKSVEISCPKCKTVYKKNKYLKQHYRLGRCGPLVQNESEANKCEICGQPLPQHRPIKSVEFTCQKCKAVFKRKEYLKRHNLLSRCAGREPSDYEDICEKCGSTFATNELLRNHKIFERCGLRVRAQNRNQTPHESLDAMESGLNIQTESLPEDETVCPVATCRRSFKSGRYRNSHILEEHTTWDGKCVTCGEKFDRQEDIFDHMKEDHGSRDTFYEENLVRVKTEEILEDVIIKVEPEIEIKQETVVPKMESGLVENEICNVKIKQEICDVANVKCEPDQYLHY